MTQITIIGLGLIGGSLAKALKAQDADCSIHGVDASHEARSLLGEAGAVDSASLVLTEEYARSTEVLVIATPPHTWAEIANALSALPFPHLRLSMDVGSVKEYAAQCFAHLPHFVPAHPIAGSEFSGAAFSTEGLFQGKRVILTPLPDASEADISYAEDFWSAVGAHPHRMESALHDRIYAYVSHLPQVMAYAIAHGTLSHGYAPESTLRPLRLAGSSPSLWTGIVQHNPYIRNALEHCLQVLNHLLAELKTGALDASTPTDFARGLSLLPRLIASTLIGAVTTEEKRYNLRMASYAGSGFADMTAPAMTPPEEDLALISTHTNDVIAVLSAVEISLRNILLALTSANWHNVQELFTEAQSAYLTQLQEP
jgi:prephenate dehydrogenase